MTNAVPCSLSFGTSRIVERIAEAAGNAAGRISGALRENGCKGVWRVPGRGFVRITEEKYGSWNFALYDSAYNEVDEGQYDIDGPIGDVKECVFEYFDIGDAEGASEMDPETFDVRLAIAGEW